MSPTLARWLTHLERLHPREMELGLDRIRTVWRALGSPRPGRRVITVAGTNGKGSVVRAMATLLGEHGVRWGETTSPHLVRFNERIVVAGREATDAEVIDAFTRIEAARSGVSLTYFEFAVLAALDLLARADCDYALLEVGLGGRLDAVNVVDADVAVVTAVDLDHQAWLGDDRETIGREKAGIMRPGRPVVLAETAPPASVLEAAERLAAPVSRPPADHDLTAGEAGGLVFHGRGPDGRPLRIDRLPEPELARSNVAAALQALAGAGLDLDPAATGRALAGMRLPGRVQRERIEGIEVVLDVAHNPHAAAHLADRLRAEDAGREVRHIAVFGTFRDKDAVAMAAALDDLVDRYRLVATTGPRGRGADALWRLLEASGTPGTRRALHACHGDVASALTSALDDAHACADATRILVYGSFTVVGAAGAALARRIEGGRTG